MVVHRAEESHAEYILYLYSVKTLYRALRWSHSLTTSDRLKRKGCASCVVPNQGLHSAMAILKANLPADFTRIKIFYDWGLCEDYWRATGAIEWRSQTRSFVSAGTIIRHYLVP